MNRKAHIISLHLQVLGREQASHSPPGDHHPQRVLLRYLVGKVPRQRSVRPGQVLRGRGRCCHGQRPMSSGSRRYRSRIRKRFCVLRCHAAERSSLAVMTTSGASSGARRDRRGKCLHSRGAGQRRCANHGSDARGCAHDDFLTPLRCSVAAPCLMSCYVDRAAPVLLFQARSLSVCLSISLSCFLPLSLSTSRVSRVLCCFYLRRRKSRR